MAFNLGELLSGMHLDLAEETTQPQVTAAQKGHTLVVSITAYLIGVAEEKFSDRTDTLSYKMDVFRKLDREDRAKIIRSLCIVRTGIEKNYTKIYTKSRREHLSILRMPEYVSYDDLVYLDKKFGLYSACDNPQKLLVVVNGLISARINNCKDFYPDWLHWDYMKKIFIMPRGNTEEGTKQAADYYYAHYNRYPFHIYINWIFNDDEETGNLLYNDAKFVPRLYQQNGDDFTDMSRISDVSERTKISIFDFIDHADKIVALVDCENSDPYALCAAIDGFEPESRDKISKIVLIDGSNAGTAWKKMQSYVSVPVEYRLTERVLDHKSMVDMTLAVLCCREYFENGVDSFLLISSDSDYWALISTLPEARFLVMVEHDKCSRDLKAKLLEENIYYAYLDDFYSANTVRIRNGILMSEIQDELRSKVQMNLKELMKEKMHAARVDMSETERTAFYDKYLKTIKFTIDNDGNITVVTKRL